MTGSSLASAFAAASAMLAAGVVFGLGYFVALFWRTGPAILTLARIIGAIVILAFAVRLGALPLLATLLGFLLARTLAMHAVRRAC
jgi:hypothetical protein